MNVSTDIAARLESIFRVNGEWDKHVELTQHINNRMFKANGGLPLVTQIELMQKLLDKHLQDHETRSEPYDKFLWILITAAMFGVVGFLVRAMMEKLAA